jgi:hypothetical protein
MFKWLRAIKRAYDVERLEAAEKWMQKAALERAALKRKHVKRAAKYEALRKRHAVPEGGRQIVVGGLVEKSGR